MTSETQKSTVGADGEFSAHVGERRSFVVHKETAAFLEQRPDVLQRTLALVNRLDAVQSFEGREEVDNDIAVEFLETRGARRMYKVTLGGVCFFLKKNPDHFDAGQSGPRELISMQQVKERLSDLPWVDIVQYRLAYKNKNTSYVVSDWNGTTRVNRFDRYLRRLTTILEKETNAEALALYSKLKERESVVKERLQDFFEVKTYNMAYDEEQDKVILFDMYI